MEGNWRIITTGPVQSMNLPTALSKQFGSWVWRRTMAIDEDLRLQCPPQAYTSRGEGYQMRMALSLVAASGTPFLTPRPESCIPVTATDVQSPSYWLHYHPRQVPARGQSIHNSCVNLPWALLNGHEDFHNQGLLSLWSINVLRGINLFQNQTFSSLYLLLQYIFLDSSDTIRHLSWLGKEEKKFHQTSLLVKRRIDSLVNKTVGSKSFYSLKVGTYWHGGL